MDPKDILARIGLTDSELRDFLKKLNRFYESLSTAEKRLFRAAMPTREEALRSLGPGITADQLEAFIRSREPKDAKTVFIIRISTSNDQDDEEDDIDI